MKKINIKKCVALFLAVTLAASQFGGYISADAADERYVMTPSDLNVDGSTSGATSEVTTYQGVDAYKITPRNESVTEGDTTTNYGTQVIKRDRWNLAGKNLSANDYKYVAVDYYYDVEESTGGSFTNWKIGGEYVDDKDKSATLSATYGPTVMEYDAEVVGDANPEYVMCLASKWQEFKQHVEREVGATYILTCDYYMPANATGYLVFYGEGGTYNKLKTLQLSGGTEGKSGKAVLEYTLESSLSWFAAGAQQDSDTDGYYWNFCVTKIDADGNYSGNNLLKNGNFATGDTTNWEGVNTTYGTDEVVEYNSTLFGDSTPEYMAKLYHTYTNSEGTSTTWKEIGHPFTPVSGTTYLMTCDYYMPAGAAGTVSIVSATHTGDGVATSISGGDSGTKGTAQVVYTAQESDSWMYARLIQSSSDSNSGDGYYWNIKVTELGSDENLLTNGDFTIDDTTANAPEYMAIRLDTDTEEWSTWKDSSTKIVKNQWARVIFDVTDFGQTATYSQMHFFPWGCTSGGDNGLNTGATAEGTMYINNLSFYTSAPGEPSITEVSFVSDELEVLCGGSVAVPNVTVSGENYPITAYDLTLSGHSSSDTYISEGRLYIGEDETATELTIQATAVVDSTQTATCTISIVNSINRTEFDEENIVTRFGVVSDTHVSGSWNQERSIGKFAHMIDVFQKTAADDGATLDALLVNGDFVDAVASSGNVVMTDTYGDKETQNFREVNYVAQGLWGTNPEYMGKVDRLYGMIYQAMSDRTEGNEYTLTCHYYMPEGATGSIRFYGTSGTGGTIKELVLNAGSSGTATLTYTLNETDAADGSWFGAGIMHTSTTAGYYWDFCLTKNEEETNLLKNADFTEGDGTWNSWSYSTGNSGSHKVVPYDEWLCGDASESGLNKTDTTTGYGTGLYEGTRLFYSLGNHDETGEGQAKLSGYDTLYSAEYFAAIFCGWQYAGTAGDTSYRGFIQDLIAYHAYYTSGTETKVTADAFYSTHGVTLASAYQKFVKFYGFDEDYSSEQGLLYGNRHMTIGEGNDAIHFVALELSLSDTSLAFLENICETSVNEDINKPIFVLTHYKVSENMPGYGEDDVEDAVKEVMAKYPQIILFGGHSHTYLHSDLAIDSDAGFIQVDTSTTAYASQSYLINAALSGVTGLWDSESESWVYPVNVNANANAKENHAYSMGCYVEVDKNFNVRIKRIDLYRSYSAEYAEDSALYSDTIFTDYATQASAEETDQAVFVRDAWDITDIGTAGLHLADYNTTTRKAATTAPVLTGSSSIKTSVDGSTVTADVTLDAADDGLVYMYVVELWNKDTDTLVSTKYLTNRFYDYPNTGDIPTLEATVQFTDVTIDGTAYEVKAYPIDEFKVKGDAISVAVSFVTAKGATISTSAQTVVKMGFQFKEAREHFANNGETVTNYGTVLYAGDEEWNTMKTKAQTFITDNNYAVTDADSGYAITKRTIGTDETELPDVYSVLISNSNLGTDYDNRGKRITAIAYVVTEDGDVYYSDTVIKHSVMSVLKNIYKETYLTDEANVVDDKVVSDSLLAKALEQSQATYSDLKAALTAAPTSAAQRDLLFEVHYALNNYAFVLKEDESTLQLYAQSGGTDEVSATLRTAIMNAEDEVALGTGTKYYISEDGDDQNDGTSSDTAVASYSAISSKLVSGDNVLFERGGVYRGCIELVSGVTYAAYGEGDKPAIYGSAKNYCYDGAWTETDTKNVWVCEDVINEDIGTIVFDHGWAAGRRIYTRTSTLEENFEFYQVIDSESADYGKVYLYLDRDPVETFYDIEFCVKGNILNAGQNITDVTIDNLSIKYGGSHGIRFDNGSSNISITNCELAWIGGSLQKGDGTSFENDASIRYGNAVEFWQNTDTVTVSNNWVYQIYDAGLTHQGTTASYSGLGGLIYIETGYTQSNITFSGNLIEYCSYGIEYFTGNHEKDEWSKITYSGNIIRFAGYGWGQVRPNSWAVSSICGWGGESHPPFSSTNFVIRNNFFDRSTNWLILHYYMETIDGETNDQYNKIVTFTGNSYYQDPCQKDESGNIWGAYAAYWLNREQLNIWNQERFEEVVAQIDTTPVLVKYLQ